MSRLLRTTALVAMLAVLLVSLALLSCGHQAEPATYAEALEMARTQQKPLLIDFYGES